MSEHSGGSFWLDAVLYDSAPLKADVLLEGASHGESALSSDHAEQLDTVGRHALDQSMAR